jgi:hypothetical protein
VGVLGLGFLVPDNIYSTARIFSLLNKGFEKSRFKTGDYDE